MAVKIIEDEIDVSWVGSHLQQDDQDERDQSGNCAQEVDRTHGNKNVGFGPSRSLRVGGLYFLMMDYDLSIMLKHGRPHSQRMRVLNVKYW